VKEKYHEYQKMFSVEKTLWWYKILHLLIYRTINRYFSNKTITILDAGCGTGGMMRYLINRGYNNIQGFDVSKHAIEFTRKCKLDVSELNLLEFTESKMDKSFDVIISNDTLCYFDNSGEQKKVLNNFYNNLNKNGIVIMNLPSLDQFEGIHDIAVGLKMRFTIDRITNLIDSDEFEIKQMKFWPFMLSPLIYVLRKNQMRKIIKGDYKVVSDIDVPFSPINNFLYLLTKLEISIFNDYPFGSSLLVILKKI